MFVLGVMIRMPIPTRGGSCRCIMRLERVHFLLNFYRGLGASPRPAPLPLSVEAHREYSWISSILRVHKVALVWVVQSCIYVRIMKLRLVC